VGRKALNFAYFILIPLPCELVPLAGSGAKGREHPDPTIRAGIEGILKRFREGQDAFRGTAKRFDEMLVYIAQWETVFRTHELCTVLLYLLPS
jgi:hypothetical protein